MDEQHALILRLDSRAADAAGAWDGLLPQCRALHDAVRRCLEPLKRNRAEIRQIGRVEFISSFSLV